MIKFVSCEETVKVRKSGFQLSLITLILEIFRLLLYASGVIFHNSRTQSFDLLIHFLCL